MINKVLLIGNVGQEPEIRKTQNGDEVATLSLATTESWKDKNSGERKDKTEWHKVVIFNKGLVMVTKNYVKKGSKLYVKGVLRTRKWTDDSGNDRYSTEVVLENFSSDLKLLSKVENEGKDSSRNYKQYGNNAKDKPVDNNNFQDDEIPF